MYPILRECTCRMHVNRRLFLFTIRHDIGMQSCPKPHTELHFDSMPLPMPMTLHGYTNKSTRCTPTGILKSIGWSSFYMTDACGKAFQALYDNVGVLGQAFDLYWDTVSKKFAKKPGVLGYEILNEPWVGDYIRHPDLLFEAGAAERGPVGRLMQRAHDVIRQHDPETPVLFSPAEVNNRLLRPVGYEEGFLPGEPVICTAFHSCSSDF